MESERGSAVSPARRNPDTSAKLISPVNAKKIVSVATVFKQQPRKTKQNDTTQQAKPGVPVPSAAGGSVAKAMSVKSRSNSRNPHKAGSRVSKNRSIMHPLAVSFKGKVCLTTRFDISPADVLVSRHQ